MSIKIIYNKKKCIVCNYCIINNPDIWVINKNDGKPDLINSTEIKNLFYLTSIDQDYDYNLNISKNCPVSAIQILKNK